MNKCLLVIFLCYLLQNAANAQCLTALFNFPDDPYQVCLQQEIVLTNTSLNATQYEWDFCPENFSETPSITTQGIAGLSQGRGLKIVNDGISWFGFLTSRNNNSLFRLEFGTDPESTPVITNLGDLSGNLLTPEGIDIRLDDNGNWYGFTGSSTGGKLLRLEFGSSLTNTPTVTNFEPVVSGQRFRDMVIVKENGNYILVATSFSTNRLFRINFGNSLGNSIDATDVVSDVIPGASGLIGLAVTQICNDWYIHTVSFTNNTVQQIFIEGDIFNTPEVQLSENYIGINNPFRVKVCSSGGKFYVVISNQSSPVSVIDFDDLTLNQEPLIVDNQELPSVIGVDLLWHKGKILLIGGTSSSLSTSSFEKICPQNFSFSLEMNPTGLYYSIPGNYEIDLRASNGDLTNVNSQSLDVINKSLPVLNIITDGVCIDAPVNFSVESDKQFSSINWDFDDGNSSTVASPSHIYNIDGVFTPSIIVTDNDGCLASKNSEIKIYPPPSPSFTLPSGLICTNNEIIFPNTTPDIFDGNLTYQWYVDDEQAETTRDLHYAFDSEGAKAIRLEATIPGCTSEETQMTSNIMSGPVIDFSFSGACQDEPVQFNSEIEDAVTSYAWDFADGNASTEVDPQHVFADAGEFTVSLTATSPSGCNNSAEETITIYSKPQPDFEILPPPLSCSGTATAFSDITTEPEDSNIISWMWNFDDVSGAGNISDLQNPDHIFADAGDYDVSLDVTTDEGCSASVQKSITIAQTPVIDFNYTVACANMPVDFKATGNDIKSFYWEMGTSYYTTEDPVHTFILPDDYPVTLSVVGDNECVAVIDKTITVPQPLVPDFSVMQNCIGYNSVFTDATTGDDPVTDWLWDFNGEGSGTDATSSFLFSSGGDKTIGLTVTGQSGCQYQKTSQITVVPAPKAGFTVTPALGAAPLEVQFINTSENATDYSWNFEDGSPPSDEESPVYTFMDLGEYNVELTALNNEGCTDKVSMSITTVAPLPDVDLKVISLSENPDGSLKVIITLQNKGNTVLKDLPVEIDISGNTTLTEIIKGPVYPASQYNLVLSYGIAQTDNLTFLCADAKLEDDQAPEGNRICTELQDKLMVFAPYPNPAKSELHFEWVAHSGQLLNLVMTDIFGKQLFTAGLSSAEGLNTYTIPVDGLQTGIYFLNLKAGTLQKTLRFFVLGEN